MDAQVIRNPSFEGNKGASTIPPEWERTIVGSTPDIQPGYWGVTALPADGKTYISLITRGHDYVTPNTRESVQQKLTLPLKKEVAYQYSIDLARSASFYSSNDRFENPVFLRVYGHNGNLEERELLWESKPIKHESWKQYPFIAQPEKNSYQYIYLEVFSPNAPSKSGNLLLDNFYFYPTT